MRACARTVLKAVADELARGVDPRQAAAIRVERRDAEPLGERALPPYRRSCGAREQQQRLHEGGRSEHPQREYF